MLVIDNTEIWSDVVSRTDRVLDRERDFFSISIAGIDMNDFKETNFAAQGIYSVTASWSQHGLTAR